MPPTFVAVGTVAAGTTTITPAFPAGIAVNDILLTVCESVGGQNYNLPSGWAHVSSDGVAVSPVVQGTNTQLTVFWRRYDGVFTAPALTGTTDHAIGRMIAIRGCPLSNNPWNVVATAVEAVSDVTASFPGATTTVPDTLVLEIIASSSDPAAVSTTECGVISNGNYTSITERIDNGDPTGNGGVIGVDSGIKATAGATGSSGMTLFASGFKAMMTLAMVNSASRPSQSLFNRRTAVTRQSRW